MKNIEINRTSPPTRETDLNSINPGNQFDDIRISVSELYRNYPVDIKENIPHRHTMSYRASLKFISTPLLLMKFKFVVWSLFRRLNLDWSWFEDFSEYWEKVLHRRPLWGPQDLFFLKNHYRIRFQSSDLDESTGDGRASPLLGNDLKLFFNSCI